MMRMDINNLSMHQHFEKYAKIELILNLLNYRNKGGVNSEYIFEYGL